MHKATNIVNPFGFKKHVGGLSEPKSAISGTESRVWIRLFEWLLSMLHEMPSNLKGKNVVSKIQWYCPQNTMAFFSSKLDGIKK